MSALAEALSFDDSGYAAIEGAAALLKFRESRRGSAPSARRSTTLGQLTARPTRSRQCQAPADPAAAKRRRNPMAADSGTAWYSRIPETTVADESEP